MTKKDILKRTLITLVNITIFWLLLSMYVAVIFYFCGKMNGGKILLLSSNILFYLLYKFLIFDWKLNSILDFKNVYSHLLMPILYFLIYFGGIAIYAEFVDNDRNNKLYMVIYMLFNVFIIPLIISSFHLFKKNYSIKQVLKTIYLPIIYYEVFFVIFIFYGFRINKFLECLSMELYFDSSISQCFK